MKVEAEVEVSSIKEKFVNRHTVHLKGNFYYENEHGNPSSELLGTFELLGYQKRLSGLSSSLQKT